MLCQKLFLIESRLSHASRRSKRVGGLALARGVDAGGSIRASTRGAVPREASDAELRSVVSTMEREEQQGAGGRAW